MAASSSASSSSAWAQTAPTEAFIATQKQEYLALCRRLNLDSENERAAWALLEKFYDTGSGNDGSRVWPICALFLIFSKSVPTVSAPAAYISLSQLLREANLRIMDFFDPLESFISHAFAHDSEGRQGCALVAKNLQLRFVTITILFRKYQKMFDEFFVRDKTSGSTGRSNLSSSGRKRLPPGSVDPLRVYNLGWVLFLVARGKILNQGQPDFLKLVYLLLCCVDLLLVHAPDAVRRIRLQELTTVTHTHLHSVLPPSRQDTLSRLCTKKDLHYSSVKEFQERVFLPFITTNLQLGVLNAEPDHASASHHGHSQNTQRDTHRDFLPQSTMYLPGLMESCLDQNYRNLDREYGAQLFMSCDFDERLFLTNHPQLQTPLKGAAPSSSTDSAMLSPTKILGSPSHFSSSSGSAPSSPVKTTLSATSWLRRTVRPEGQNDSAFERLQNTINHIVGPKNASLDIQKQAEALMAQCSFGPDDTDGRRREEATLLYYRLLDLVLAAEEKRLAGSSSLKSSLALLLNSAKFQKSLLVVAAEIVFSCYNFPHAATPQEFPHSLTIFGVSAYDFGKVIESVVRAEISMPRSVVKHLVRLEERVLEHLAWAEGSPLYDSLNKPEEKENLLQRLGESGSPQQISSSPCQIFSTPVKQIKKEESAPPSTPSSQKTTSLDLFLRKVSHLVSLRVRKLCDDLQISLPYTIPERIVQQIEYAVLYIITQTDLMLNRHMDVIMMCTVYSLAKVSMPQLAQQQPITFKLIIEKYHLQPQARVPIYKYVRVADNLDEDVIKFYNKIFLPQLETFLLSFQPPSNSSGPDSPAHATRQAGAKRATRSSEQKAPATPQPRKNALQQISSPISFEKPRPKAATSTNAPNSAVKSPVKVGNFYFSPMRGAATPLGLSRAHHHPPSGGGRLVFQFGMSPHRQLDDINKSVNRDVAARKKLNFDLDALAEGAASAASPSSSQESAAPDRRRSAKRKLDLDGDVTPPMPSSKRSRQSD